MIGRAHRQRGFTIIAAIFILVVLAGLGGAILTVSSNQQIGSALDVQGVRAYLAARAGIEWGLYQQLRNGSCVASSSVTPSAPTLSGFSVIVTCQAYADTNGGPDVHLIESTASSGTVGSFTYVERRVKVSF